MLRRLLPAFWRWGDSIAPTAFQRHSFFAFLSHFGSVCTIVTIRKSLMQIYPNRLTGRQAQHMNTLSGMISGIVRSGKSQMRAMSKTAPDRRSKVESRIKRFTRFTQNEGVDTTTYFLPFVTSLLIGLARSGPLVLAIDGSEVGRNCLALVVSVIYTISALCPWSGSWFKEAKGTFLKKHMYNWCKLSNRASQMVLMSFFWGMASLMGLDCKQK